MGQLFILYKPLWFLIIVIVTRKTKKIIKISWSKIKLKVELFKIPKRESLN